MCAKSLSVVCFGLALIAGNVMAQGSLMTDPDLLEPRSDSVVEGRFKSDTTNWDLRLAGDGTPVAGGNQANIGNGTGFFEGRTFRVAVTYDADSRDMTLDATRTDGRTAGLRFNVDEGLRANALRLGASASRGSLSVRNISMVVGGIDQDFAADLDVDKDASRYQEETIFFGNDANLYAGDFTFDADVTFNELAHRNPNEGLKFFFKFVDVTAIPAPGALAVLPGLLVFSRRR